MKTNEIILQNIETGILILDSNYTCLYTNEYMKKNYICNVDDICSFKKLIHKDDIENDNKYCDEFFKSKQSINNICRVYNNLLNTFRWINIKRTFDYKDEQELYIHLFQDIHDLKELECKLITANEKFEKEYNHKSIFLANMSHEIRTPLNGIMGMITLLDDTKLSNEQKDYLDMLTECSINLMAIINDILDFSKLDADKISLDYKCTNIRHCIDSTNDILLSKINEKNIDYIPYFFPDVPEFINVDNSRLKQILLNLLNNAIKFTDNGTISLHISKMYIKNVLYLKFTIKDTGCGISESDKHKLFKSFSQIDSSTNKLNEGTGLGLAISDKLVKLMGGKLWLDSSCVNKGSTFCFTIKTKICHDILPKQIDFNIFKHRKIFILDDKVENRLTLANMVQKWGCIPQTFNDSREALYFLKNTDFDLGLVDICMPEINGKEFSKKFKEQNILLKKKNIPLIALSSLGDKNKDYSLYFYSHLIKPVKESKLKDICNNLLINSTSNASINHNINTDFPNNFIDNSLDLIKDNIRILLVEDIPVNQIIVIRFLNKLGYNQIDTADNGKICLEMLSIKQYDVILLDIKMPVINGITVFNYINQYYKDQMQVLKSDKYELNFKLLNITRPYIIAVTAYSLKEDREKYLHMGFDSFVSKPITITEINNVMDVFMKEILKN